MKYIGGYYNRHDLRSSGGAGMILFWRIRYHDSADKQFKDRDLWLDTSTLAPALRAAVEVCSELRDTGGGRTMLKYRHLFEDEQDFDGDINDQVRIPACL